MILHIKLCAPRLRQDCQDQTGTVTQAEIVGKSILPCDTYNCDEIGFRIGISEDQ
jgi:hypothetical protein